MGVYSLMNMPRSENPKIDIPIASVYAFYPGADEKQVEQEVTKKIEQYLFSFEEVKKRKTKSETKEGQTFITVEMNTEVKDRKKFWHTIQLDMDANLRPNLPAGVIGPFVNSNFSDVTAMIITVSSPIRSYAEIEKYLDKLEDGLKAIPSVSKINRSGTEKQQLYINVNDQKMQQYGFDIATLAGVLQRQNITGYSGELNMSSDNIISINTASRYRSETDIANQIVYTKPDGIVVRLKDVASIERRFEEKTSYVRVDDEKAMILSIDMQPGHNIVQFGHEVEKKIKEVQSTFPPDIKINTPVNQPEVVAKSISQFMKEFGTAIGAVIIVIMQLLPVTVAIALIASMLVALLFTPYTCYVFIKKGLKHKISNRPVRKSMLDKLQSGFNKAVEFCFGWPKSTMLVGVASVFLAIVIAGKVDPEFFPINERNQFNMEVWMPSGTSLPQTESTVKRLEEILKKDKRVTNVTSFMGMSSPRFNVAYAPEAPRRNYAQIFIATTTVKAADDMVHEYLKKLDGFIPDGNIKLKQLSFQEGSPIAIRVIGDDEGAQKKVAQQVKTILENAKGTNGVRLDNEEDYFGIKLKINEDKANRLGISNQSITQTLGAGLKGYSISTLWEGDKPVDIFLRYDSASRKNSSAIENLHVSSAYGGKIPLKEVADLTPAWHTGMIAHRNGLRTLTVFSEAQLGIKSSRILKEIQPQIDKLKLPSGIRIAYGGDAETNEDNQPPMMVSLGVSLILIFLTLLFQFKNFG